MKSPSAIHTQFEILAVNRHLLKKVTGDLSPAALTEIPDGFANNILWNAGHLLVTQQLLCYRMSNLPMAVDDSTVEMFRKGSTPKDWSAAPDYDALLGPLEDLVQTTRQDYDDGRFETFNAYTTSTGFTLGSVEDAIAFNNFHEGIHLGYILALRRAVG